MSDQMVVLFSGDPTKDGLRLEERTRDPDLVDQVRAWFATKRRGDVARLERGDRPAHLEVVPEDDPGPAAA